MDEKTPMVKAITEGLLAKHGKEFKVDEELKRLQINYIVKIE
jgi:hypothetical protein